MDSVANVSERSERTAGRASASDVRASAGRRWGVGAQPPRHERASEPMVPVRDDLQALRGYHSAQVDVEVRLNTNESPYPPPAQWEEELAAALAAIDWRRYPDRAATASAVGDRRMARRRNGQRVRRQRLERGAADAAADVRRARPRRRHVRADVPVALAHRPPHGCGGRARVSGDPTSRSTSTWPSAWLPRHGRR